MSQNLGLFSLPFPKDVKVIIGSSRLDRSSVVDMATAEEFYIYAQNANSDRDELEAY